VTFYSQVGSWQKKDFWPHAPKEKAILAVAREAIERGDLTRVNDLLTELVKKENPEALYLAASFSFPETETEESYETRRLLLLKRAADKEYAPALYALGVAFDTGDQCPFDPEKAASLFKAAAEQGHAHSQWLHGLNLIHGINGVRKDVKKGITFIRKSARYKIVGAIQSLAEFYEKGLFGFPKSNTKAKQWRAKLNDEDIIEL